MQAHPDPPGRVQPAGLVWTWWRGDPLPTLPTLPNVVVRASSDAHVVADATARPVEDIAQFLRAGHRPYLAYVGAEPVGFGWCASTVATFGSPPHHFTLPPHHGYLGDFFTVPTWRGRGVYPWLLQHIVTAEATRMARFWILHQWANVASARGIEKAGFQAAGQIWFVPSGGLGLRPLGDMERAHVGAEVLAVTVLAEVPDQSGAG